MTVRQITVSRLRQWLADAARPAPVLLDVLEPWEFAICAIPGSLSLPLGQLAVCYETLARAAETVVICHHGLRSLQAALFLEHVGLPRVFNLQGGIDAWARMIDRSMAVY